MIRKEFVLNKTNAIYRVAATTIVLPTRYPRVTHALPTLFVHHVNHVPMTMLRVVSVVRAFDHTTK